MMASFDEKCDLKQSYPDSSSSMYSPSDSEEETNQLLDNEARTRERASRIWEWRTPTAILMISVINGIFFIVSTALFSTWYYNTHMRPNPQLRQASTYTPIMDKVDVKMRPQFINGTLFPSESPSVARLSPSQDVDAVWDDWELDRVIPITLQDLQKMGKDPETAVKLEDDLFGLGEDMYAATLDVFHVLHCLNEMRKLIYPDYYSRHHTEDWNHDLYYAHMGHCVDILMQNVQCQGNLNLVTLHWHAEEPYPFPDMSVNRQCIDFEGLTEWRTENSIPVDEWTEKMKDNKPEGVKEQPWGDQWYKAFNKTNPNR